MGSRTCLSAHDQSIFELDHGHHPLPDGLQGSGIYVQGHNRSDDLFMFLKKTGWRAEAERGICGLRIPGPGD